MSAQIIPFVTAIQAQALRAKVREFAEQGKVWMHVPHFKTRMLERGINMRQVFETLKKGRHVGVPRWDESKGEWSICLKRFSCGKSTTVIVAIGDDYISPITVY